jgi:hypothetical protein
MIEIPVKYAWQTQLADVFHVQFKRAGPQAYTTREMDQSTQR